MSTSVIETLDEESTNLALHVQVCEQRYIQLITKLDQVDTEISNVHEILKDINNKLGSNKEDQLKTYLKWAGVIITVLTGIVVHFIVK